MPAWYYFQHPTHYAFHDKTTRLKAPPHIKSLLGNSLKFIPNRKETNTWTQFKSSTWDRFNRDIKLKVWFGTDTPDDDDQYNPRMYIKSTWNPPFNVGPKGEKHKFPPRIKDRLRRFEGALGKLFQKRYCPSNLLPNQRRALRYLRQNKDLLVVPCDKNLGPALIERDEYIKMAWRDHFRDRKTYRRLTEASANIEEQRIRRAIDDWLTDFKDEITKSEKKFIQTSIKQVTEPFPTFYLTLKVHKSPLKSRPIVSCSGTLLESLGVWVDSKLQIAAQRQWAYFKSSYELVQQLKSLDLPPNTFLFTADAVSMYTNIPTNKALLFIGKYLREKRYPGVPIGALMRALQLIMRNNIVHFGDTYHKQLCGTAMGTPPAPPYANLYAAIKEERALERFSTHITFFRRFIDDIFGMFTFQSPQDVTVWEAIKEDFNDPLFELEWEFSPLSKSVDFMDLTISIDSSTNRISTTLYEKKSNLHLYIPPHSCHPPGVLQGMVFGCIHRIYTLCSDPADQHARTQQFYRHLSARGYKRETLAPLFAQAVTKAKAYTGPKEKQGIPKGAILFHLQYNPKLPPSREIQQAWRQNMLQPHSRAPTLGSLKNHNGSPNGLERLIVAYSRAPNLGNLLSSRKIKPDSGPPVSSYFDQGPND